MALTIIASVIFLDQITKFLAVRLLRLNTPVILIKNFLNLTLVHNRGAAFGLFQNQLFMFVLISIFAIALILHNLRNKKNSFIFKLSLSLILGGSAGNLIDRLRFGFVIDFLDLRIWPVFNLADSVITIAAILLTWELLFKKNAA
ncbi:MAG: signal peptidase II [Candidatus Omnitrophica bacterium]|nr:signal peptidase II [Candidatus Omnitrophota bacterium]